MRSKRRLQFVLFVMVCVGLAAALSLYALRDNLAYFHTPHEVKALLKANSALVRPGQNFRLGGLVMEGSLQKSDEDAEVRFTVTDTVAEITVIYKGILPDLFREGQGVVATGRLDRAGVFTASELLAKHDENYMPPEVARGLRKAGEGKKPGSAP